MNENGSVEGAASIGVVWMEGNRTIVVRLRAEGPDGMLGEANLIFKRRNPLYEKVLRYVGNLKPGEARQVYEWDFALSGK